MMFEPKADSFEELQEKLTTIADSGTLDNTPMRQYELKAVKKCINQCEQLEQLFKEVREEMTTYRNSIRTVNSSLKKIGTEIKIEE